MLGIGNLAMDRDDCPLARVSYSPWRTQPRGRNGRWVCQTPNYRSISRRRRWGLLLAKWLFDEKRSFIEVGTGCWRCRFRVSSDGIVLPRIRFKAASAYDGAGTLRLYRVAFMAWNGRDIRPGMVASHLCGNRDCFNPVHIVEESQAMNVSRSTSGCLGRIVCRQHGSVLSQVCVHVPMCLSSIEVKCCLGVKERVAE